MSCPEAVFVVGLLLALLSSVFVVVGLIADYLWPWIDDRWHARNARPRPQATYRQRHP